MEKLRLAVIGTGMLVNEILPHLYNMKEIDLKILCGTARSAEIVKELQNKYEIPCSFTDYGEMLESHSLQEVDVIYLAVPNHLHYDMALAALEHGKHVFLEKPFVTTLTQAEHLVSAARERRLFLLEAISNQYFPVYDKIRSLLPLLGDIKYVDCNYSQYSSRFDRFLAGEYFRVFDPACDGGALMDLNVYNLHLAAGLFGAPRSVSYYPNIMRGVDTSGVLHLAYPGFHCTCTAAKDSPGPSRFLIQGTRGYLQVTAPANSMNGPLEFYQLADKQITTFEFPQEAHRMIPEFRALAEMISRDDYDQCLARQDESLIVCRMLAQARGH